VKNQAKRNKDLLADSPLTKYKENFKNLGRRQKPRYFNDKRFSENVAPVLNLDNSFTKDILNLNESRPSLPQITHSGNATFFKNKQTLSP
jgi:hypothetical protein